MNSSQIEKNVRSLVENIDRSSFIYDLLLAYGISKTSITRLRTGDFNLSNVPGEVLYKKKVLFKEVDSDKTLITIDNLTKDESALKHNPRFVIVTDYNTLLAKDTRTGLALDTPILEIYKHFDFFLPWAGQEKYHHKNENYADRKASYEMARLYDILVHENDSIYEDGGHNLNIFLSRLLFCFFAEDTDIFPEEGLFTSTLLQHTNEDGSDVHEFLNKLFKVLNNEDNSSEASYLQKFPYVNGGLFKDPIQAPKFSKKARKIIIECGELNWSEINPDIFGSMLQAVVRLVVDDDNTKHYTSVPNIMKVIEPLFLTEFYYEFEKNKENIKALRKLIYRLSKIKIFDPACGSGNFLIISYKELRKLEINIWKQIDFLKKESKLSYQTETVYTEVKLSQFYGIELDDFAHEMAVLSLWLAEHQMDKIFINELFDFGKAEPILPLKEAGNIICGNAAKLSWNYACPIDVDSEVYVLGNPPYEGARKQSSLQKEDMETVFSGLSGYNNMDYIAIWFYLGCQYIQDYNAKCAFVSTNSICQGEQVSLIWPHILNAKIEIDFAYQSFKWTNNAKGNAGVTVIIIGLRNVQNRPKFIFVNSFQKKVLEINAYLLEGKNNYISGRSKPLSNIPEINFGSMANDGGHLLLSKQEKHNLLELEPDAKGFIKNLVGALEFIRGVEKYCIWIEDDKKEIAYSLPLLRERIDATRSSRLISKRASTNELSEASHKFAEVRYRPTDSIIIPSVSSERRSYIPIGFLNSEHVVVAPNFAIYDAEPWLFGMLTSRMHMVWMRNVSGKLKTDYRYSAKLCYNTFPFPELSSKQKENLNLYVFNILEERENHPEKTLAQLYDPIKMPNSLKHAHNELDLAIERCYRLRSFETDLERFEHLFKLYEEMTFKNSTPLKRIKTNK